MYRQKKVISKRVMLVHVHLRQFPSWLFPSVPLAVANAANGQAQSATNARNAERLRVAPYSSRQASSLKSGTHVHVVVMHITENTIQLSNGSTLPPYRHTAIVGFMSSHSKVACTPCQRMIHTAPAGSTKIRSSLHVPHAASTHLPPSYNSYAPSHTP